MSKPWIDLTRDNGWLPWDRGRMTPGKWFGSQHVSGDWQPFYAIMPRRDKNKMFISGWIERRWTDDDKPGGFTPFQYRLKP